MTEGILLPRQPRIIEDGAHAATIEIEGLHPGYGITLGNALKRVLHSSLPGSAITHVRIEGANHEFATIPGVLEDVLSILLNLKQVRFRMHTLEPQTIRLTADSEGVVTAGDIECPSSIEVINTTLPIATITDKKGKLEIELRVESGMGYVPRDMLTKDKVGVGEIALDAIFTPVRKVRYEIENMRVGSATNYNRLRLAITTDGSMTPKEAFEKAVDILMGQLGALRGLEVARTEETEEAPRADAETASDDPRSIPVADLKLSSRTINALNKEGIMSVGDLAKMNSEEILAIDGVGEKAVTEISDALGDIGISLTS